VFGWIYAPVHDYTKLLFISLSVLIGGSAAFAVGAAWLRFQNEQRIP
jgi:hypothetical protein